MKILFIFFLVLFIQCDLQNRYPDKGEFCIPMIQSSECIFVDFREKILELEKDKIELNMTNRVEYDFKFKEIQYQLLVLSEHRVSIETGNSKKIYIRKKGTKISLWKRIKNLF